MPRPDRYECSHEGCGVVMDAASADLVIDEIPTSGGILTL